MQLNQPQNLDNLYLPQNNLTNPIYGMPNNNYDWNNRDSNLPNTNFNQAENNKNQQSSYDDFFPTSSKIKDE
jgi:hypothetical protein